MGVIKHFSFKHFSIFYFIVCFCTLCFANGTGDVGDSIVHFLFARDAPFHPSLYFHHWAKPVFVLLASPFAQFGFVGVKLFNSLATYFTIYFTYQTSKQLEIRNAILIPLFMLFAPLYFILTFSSLTEPLFALVLSMGIYFCLKDRLILSLIIISFLPYVRSEGLIIMGVFVFYLIAIRNYSKLFWLSIGSIFYSVAGFFVHKNLLWVFTKIPYAKLSSSYGSGTLFHFVDQLLYVIGMPLYILLIVGLIFSIRKIILNKKIEAPFDILILVGFVVYFVAHTLFWYLGIFNSMGLKRVLIAVMPMIAILCLIGFNSISDLIKQNKWRYFFQFSFVSYVLIFPFTNHPAALNWKKEMNLVEEQKLAKEIYNSINKEKLHYNRIYFNHHYFNVLFGYEVFDINTQHLLTKRNLLAAKRDDIIIWDNRYSLIDYEIELNYLQSNPNWKLIYSNSGNEYGRETEFAVFIKK